MRYGSAATVAALVAIVSVFVVTSLATDDQAAGGAGPTASVTAERVLDTRDGLGAPRGRVRAGAVVRVAMPDTVAGSAAVAFNLTAVDAVAPGFVTAWPCDGDQPETSNLNIIPGIVSTNLAIVGTTNDEICLSSSTATHLVADVMGTFAGADDFAPARPTRLVDTRTDGSRLVGGEERHIRLEDGAGFSSGSGGVALNITVVSPSGDGYATVYPCGARPMASTVNYRAGDIVPNFTTVAYSDSEVCVFASAATDLIVDSFGWSSNSGDLRLASPTRVLDTRVGDGWTGGPANPNRTVVLQIAGIDGVPLDAQGVLLTLVATDATADGYVTIYPCDQSRPTASILNLRNRAIRANLAFVPIGDDGTVCLWAYTVDGSPVGLVADAVGWTLGGPERVPAPTTTTTSTTTAPGATTTVPGAPTTTTTAPPAGSPLTCDSVSAAFCEDFEGARNTTGNRNGDLSVARFSLARWRSEGEYLGDNNVGQATVTGCRSGLSSVLPPNDSLICDPTGSIASRHALVATAEQNYGDNLYRINQPFDIAGRTGTFSFDMSLPTYGLLSGFPLVVFSELPMSAPSYIADNSGGPTPRNGIAIQFKSSCGSGKGADVIEFDDHAEHLVANSSGCPGQPSAVDDRLNRVQVRISQSRIDIWATDASSNGVDFGPLELIYSGTISLPFSRGYLSFGVHNHASYKYPPYIASVSARWDNLVFDGPSIPATKVSQVNDAAVVSGNSIGLDYDLTASSTGALTLPGVVRQANARLVFNTWIDTVTNTNFAGYRVEYRFNGGTWRSVSLTAAELAQLPRSGSFSWTLPVDVADLQNGTNTVEFRGVGFSGGYTATIGNIDLITW